MNDPVTAARTANSAVSPALGSSIWLPMWPYAVLAIPAFAIYSGTLANGFVGDDHPQVLHNPVVTDYHLIPTIFGQDTWAFNHERGYGSSNYYRPVQQPLHKALHHLARSHPLFFHVLPLTDHIAYPLSAFSLRLPPTLSPPA